MWRHCFRWQSSYKDSWIGIASDVVIIMTTSASQPSIPTALTVPIIQGYANGIRPAFSFILIAAIFSAMLIPLLLMLLILSSPKTRRTPIFMLNVLAIVLGIIVGGLSNHLTIQSVLSPFGGVNPTEDLVYNILYIWMPWITEAVLLLRVIVVFKPTFYRLRNMILLLGFPVVVKVARAIINIVFLVQWKRASSNTNVNQFTMTQSLNTWVAKASWILELLDNGYDFAHVFDGANIGRVDTVDSRGSVTNRIKSLFWIASTNFVFPPRSIAVIFGLCQVILLYTDGNILVAASIEMVNIYISIISTVFATIWSSTWSSTLTSGQATAQSLEPVAFRAGSTRSTTVSLTGADLERSWKVEHTSGDVDV
ncbi:hypothetical protein D9757_010327 [Collybiopsis confluens]|uniref:Uncharacterized protein n=1 Tax=Collybiopsis confluens TaxID=2823264 RepID=A0A8H5GN24_9AGAR|nr:hypothetical protein D9757_010327 [Collybiopsis confluens]